MLDLNSVMIGTMRPKVLADFYTGVLGMPSQMADAENGFYAWQVGSTNLSILEHSETGGKSKDPARVILNFETREVREEFDRIKALGATVVRAPYEIGGGWVATLADPDGNYFQLVTPMQE